MAGINVKGNKLTSIKLLYFNLVNEPFIIEHLGEGLVPNTDIVAAFDFDYGWDEELPFLETHNFVTVPLPYCQMWRPDPADVLTVSFKNCGDPTFSRFFKFVQFVNNAPISS